MTLIFKII